MDPSYALLTILNLAAIIIAFTSDIASLWICLPIILGHCLFLLSHTFLPKLKQSVIVSVLASLSIPISIGILIPMVLVEVDKADLSLNSVAPIHLLAKTLLQYGDKHSDLLWTLGICLRSLSIFLILWTTFLFMIEGKGTLSPSPGLQTARLVIRGPYAHVRNPMICGVLGELLGISLMNMSTRTLLFVIVFFVVKSAWFHWIEEPDMLKRFGNEYKEYQSNVGMWIPRVIGYKLKKKE